MASIGTPRELFAHKLGVAYEMERNVLEMLEELEGKASDRELKELISHHQDETRQQVTNLERAFSALGLDPETNDSPAIEGIEKEGEKLIGKVDDALVDNAIVGGAVSTEHHEISVYESLLTMAESEGHDDIVGLLQENLEQEQHTLREMSRKAEQLTRQSAGARA